MDRSKLISEFRKDDIVFSNQVEFSIIAFDKMSNEDKTRVGFIYKCYEKGVSLKGIIQLNKDQILLNDNAIEGLKDMMLK